MQPITEFVNTLLSQRSIKIYIILGVIVFSLFIGYQPFYATRLGFFCIALVGFIAILEYNLLGIIFLIIGSVTITKELGTGTM